MNQTRKTKPYELETRTLEFARAVRSFVKLLPRSLANTEDAKQLIRSSGSVGANYIEANEALGKRDFRMRIKICRKEAKETRYWLTLLDLADTEELENERELLVKEATELLSIFSSIAAKTQ